MNEVKILLNKKINIKNKKVLVLTYDWSLNYGAKLQTFALQKYLEQYGVKVSILNYMSLSNIGLYIESDIRNVFCEKYLNKTSKCYIESELEKQLRYYDYIIIGGDQVFRNFSWWGDELPLLRYYGDFVYGKKVLASFGASFGKDSFDGDEKLVNECKKLLKRFDKIAVREKSGVDLLRNVFDIEDAIEVCDPVFLLTSKDYMKLIDFKLCKKISEDYVAYMHLSDLDNNKNTINEKLLENLKNEKIIDINLDENRQLRTVEEWLYYIANSKFVITDSFHCVAFAIIFNKPFIVVNREFGGKSRIDNILSNLGLNYCWRNSLEEISQEDLNLKIDWNVINKIIEQ